MTNRDWLVRHRRLVVNGGLLALVFFSVVLPAWNSMDHEARDALRNSLGMAMVLVVLFVAALWPRLHEAS